MSVDEAAARRMPIEIRIREQSAAHRGDGTWCSGEQQRAGESVSRVSSSKVTPGNCKKGLVLPADQREMLLPPFPLSLSLSRPLSLSPSCSSCALLLRLQFTPSIYISHPSHTVPLCVLYLPAFLQLRPSALATAHADFSKNRSIPHTNKHTHAMANTLHTESWLGVCVRWTGAALRAHSLLIRGWQLRPPVTPHRV